MKKTAESIWLQQQAGIGRGGQTIYFYDLAANLDIFFVNSEENDF
jgi:hypothetical protein